MAVGMAASLTIGVLLVRIRNRPELAQAERIPERALVAGLVGITLLVFLAHGINSALTYDEGVFVVTNIEVANGHLPYVAAFDNTGPLGPWFGGLGVAIGRIFGLDAVASARMAYLPVALLAVLAVFRLGRDVGLSAKASAAGAFGLVAMTSFSREALSGPRPKLLVVAVLIMFLVDLSRSRHMRSGAWVGIATMAWQSSIVLVLVPLIAIPMRRPREGTIRTLGKFAVGGLIPAAIVFVIYALNREVPTLVEGLITWNLQTASGRLPNSLIEAVVDPLKDLWGTHQATWPFIAVGARLLCSHSVVVCLGLQGLMTTTNKRARWTW